MNWVETQLRKLFEEYILKYESCSLQEPSTSNQNSKPNASSSRLQAEIDIMEEFYKFNEEEDVMQSKSELDVYLEEKLHPSQRDDFEVSQWWKANTSNLECNL